MATLTVSLAKLVLEGALYKAQLAIEEESKLPQSAQRNLVFIAGEIQMMNSFLMVANKDRLENRVVMTWVRQIRELAYDVEDCIEFVVHLDTRPNWWWRLLPSRISMAAALPLDELVDEIEQLKARVEDVSSRNARYSLLSEETTYNTGSGATARDLLMEARKASRRQGFADLTNLIAQKDSERQVISVWGTGGDLGTRSVIRKAYSDPEICKKFTCRAWVKLVHPFDPHEFIQGLTAQFCENSEELHDEAIRGFLMISEATQGDHLKEFLQHVKGVKYLIVLEDMSSQAEWNAIKTFLPDTKNGSLIILSTQQFEIAIFCVGHPYQPLELKQFSIDHSVCALLECSSGDGEKAEEISANHEVPDIILNSKTKAAHDWMMEYPIIGRKSEIGELRQYIAKARINNFQVISIWGMAGVGKSALVKNFCNSIIDTGLFQKYGWVDVSHPFNLRDLAWNLFLNFHSESLQPNGKIRTENPIQECRDFLEQHSCLVIIDDLRCTEEWDLIKSAFLSRHSRSIFIAITTEADIATYCVDKEGELMFNVKCLQDDAAFDLFHQHVKRKKPFTHLKDLKEDVKLHELIFKFGGIPKVIVDIAGVLAEKTTLMNAIWSTSDRFMDTLETNPEFHSLQGLFDWMHSYFYNCPDSLKPCIIYMSFFPPDQSFRRRRVVRRWVAEGYSRDSRDKSAEQSGEMFFMKLVNLSIIQHPPQLAATLIGDTRMNSCRVNGFIREYIISRRVEENLDLDAGCNLTTQRIGRHLIIRESWDRDKNVFESIDFSRLRSLTVFGGWKSFFISKSMKMVRVLDLEDASGVKDDDLKNMVKLLCRLKFLSLRGCCEITSLPSSLGDLRQLQTLDIRHTHIVNLPATVTKLHKLQYVRAGASVTGGGLSTPCISLPWIHRPSHRVVGVEVPGGICKLTALHTFGVVNISKSGGNAILKELENLTQLRKLGVSGINRKNSKKLSSAMSGHLHLESLSVQLDKESQGCLDGIFLPLKSLQSLKLHGPVDKLPVLQTDQLSKLIKLDLEMTILTEDAIKLLGSLPKLCILRVKLLQGSRLHFCVKQYGLELPTYQMVKVLEIAFNSSFDVTFGVNTMRSLELLKAHCCNGSSVKFSGLRNLTALKEMLLKGCCDDEPKEELQSQLTELPMRPILKLEE